MTVYWPIKDTRTDTVRIIAMEGKAVPEVKAHEQRVGPGREDFERVKVEWSEATLPGELIDGGYPTL